MRIRFNFRVRTKSFNYFSVKIPNQNLEQEQTINSFYLIENDCISTYDISKEQKTELLKFSDENLNLMNEKSVKICSDISSVDNNIVR